MKKLILILAILFYAGLLSMHAAASPMFLSCKGFENAMDALEKGKFGLAAKPIWSLEKFFQALGFQNTGPIESQGSARVATLYMFKEYLGNEEGTVAPIRSGHERMLYQMIKGRLVNGGPLLTPETILVMAAQAVRDSQGNANIPLAFLTAHNVIRALARPDKWRDNIYQPSDPMADVFQDMRGTASTDAMDPLPVEMQKKYNTKIKIPHDVSQQGKFDPQWMSVFFKPYGNLQRFSDLPGTETALDNAGSHYYFWVGAMSEALFGKIPTEIGIGGEVGVKRSGDLVEKRLAEIEPPNAYRGMEIAKCIEEYLKKLYQSNFIPEKTKVKPNKQLTYILKEVKINPYNLDLQTHWDESGENWANFEITQITQNHVAIRETLSVNKERYDHTIDYTLGVPKVMPSCNINPVFIIAKVIQGNLPPPSLGVSDGTAVWTPSVTWQADGELDRIKKEYGSSVIAYGYGLYSAPGPDNGRCRTYLESPNIDAPFDFKGPYEIYFFSNLSSQKPILVYVYEKSN